MILWRLIVRTPSGYPEEVKVRALSQELAIAKVLGHKPEWSVANDPHGNPLIWREDALAPCKACI